MFDYIIIGGGSAGCVLAARLSEDPSVNVVLLEAGPVDSSVLIHCPAGFSMLSRMKETSWGFNTIPQPGLNGRCGYQPRGKVLGGSSSVNAMIYTRGHRTDYDAWAAEGNSGWSYDDVLPYFKRAENNERGADDWHGAGGPLNVKDLDSPSRYDQVFVDAAKQAGWRENHDFNGPEQEGVGIYQVTQKNGERWSAAKGYLTPNLPRPNLKVFTGAHTTRILLEKKRAVGVEFLHEGTLKQLKAGREVLLSAGALMSPQILMLSGIGPHRQLVENGIATLHDLAGVGENLHDHPDVVLVANAPKQTDLIGISPAGVAHVVKGILEWRRQRTGLLTTNFGEAGGFIKSATSEPIPDLQLHFAITKLIDHGRKLPFGHGYSVHVCLLRPKSRGTIKLDSNDPLAKPLIDPNFLAQRDDMERMIRAVRVTRTIMEQSALTGIGARESARSASARTDQQLEHFIRDNADTIYHPVGSCRMGSGAMDVVDTQLRVHGMQGLRVVDASIMPSVIGGNTNAPVIMIAEKAADMIKAAAKAAPADAEYVLSPSAASVPVPSALLPA